MHDKRLTSFAMYQPEYYQDLDQMRRLSPPHTSCHPQRSYAADEEEW